MARYHSASKATGINGKRLADSLSTKLIVLAASPLDQPALLRGYKENLALLDWVKRSLPRSEVLAAQNPPLVYLYTGNKTISAQNLGEKSETLRRFNVRHLVLNSPVP